MSSASNSSNSLELKVSHRFPYPRETVFKALAEGKLMAVVGGTMDKFDHDFRVGGSYEAHYGAEGFHKGQYLEIAPSDLIRFSWTSVFESVESEVNIRLEQIGNFTWIHLVHSKVSDAKSLQEYKLGWTECLAYFLDELNGTTLRVKKDFNSSAEKVFEAVKRGLLFPCCGADASSLPKDFELSKNYDLKMSNEDSIKVCFTKFDPFRRLDFSWDAVCGESKSGLTQVVVFIKKVSENSCRVDLVHDGFSESLVSTKFEKGWNWVLTEFEGILQAQEIQRASD